MEIAGKKNDQRKRLETFFHADIFDKYLTNFSRLPLDFLNEVINAYESKDFDNLIDFVSRLLLGYHNEMVPKEFKKERAKFDLNVVSNKTQQFYLCCVWSRYLKNGDGIVSLEVEDWLNVNVRTKIKLRYTDEELLFDMDEDHEKNGFIFEYEKVCESPKSE